MERISEDDQGYAIYHRLLPKENATNLDIALVQVKPGQTIPPHTHENEDQAYIVLEGRGILRLGEKEQELSEQMIVHIPPNTEHSVSNRIAFTSLNISMWPVGLIKKLRPKG